MATPSCNPPLRRPIPNRLRLHPLTHDLLSYDLIHPNMFPQVAQPIKVAAPYSKRPQKLC